MEEVEGENRLPSLSIFENLCWKNLRKWGLGEYVEWKMRCERTPCSCDADLTFYTSYYYIYLVIRCIMIFESRREVGIKMISHITIVSMIAQVVVLIIFLVSIFLFFKRRQILS